MSFSRILYLKYFAQHKLSITDLLIWGNKVYKILSDFLEGRYCDIIEKNEFEKSESLASTIDSGIELVPLVISLINKKNKDGEDIRAALLEHKHLIHALNYNKERVLSELSDIIMTLEVVVRKEEANQQTMKVYRVQETSALQTVLKKRK